MMKMDSLIDNMNSFTIDPSEKESVPFNTELNLTINCKYGYIIQGRNTVIAIASHEYIRGLTPDERIHAQSIGYTL